MTNENNKPIHKISVSGGVTASIWENSTENGVMHAVEVERRYLDGEDWKTSKTYVGAQILLVAKAYEMAFDYIQSLKSPS